MALTATASQGFELYGYVGQNDLLYVPGDPGDSYVRGDFVHKSVGEAHVDVGADSELAVGTVAYSVTCPAATQGYPAAGSFDPVAKAAADLCLIPVIPKVPAGTPIYLVTFAGHDDETVVSYSANGASTYIEATTGAAADDYPNGAICYIYEGPGAGEINVCDDYIHTGGAAELLTQFHRQFSATLTTSSKYILLAGEAAGSRGIGFFDRIDADDQNNLDCTDGANDGDWVVYGDYRTLGAHLKNLKLPVVRASAIYGD